MRFQLIRKIEKSNEFIALFYYYYLLGCEPNGKQPLTRNP